MHSPVAHSLCEVSLNKADALIGGRMNHTRLSFSRIHCLPEDTQKALVLSVILDAVGFACYSTLLPVKIIFVWFSALDIKFPPELCIRLLPN